MDKFVIGLDFGTDSVRALLADVFSGAEVKSTVHAYRRWNEGRYCDAEKSQYRQHPLDYIEGMTEAIRELIAGDPALAANIMAISAGTTGSTPVPVDESGTPLAMLPEFSENPNAMFLLWKDHTASREADEINHLAHHWHVDYTKYSGGAYSPEWFWAKILHVLRTDDQVGRKAFSWLEHCDWIPALLTGVTESGLIKRSRCAAGHKAMWHKEFGGLPSEEFLVRLDERLAGLRQRLYQDTVTADQSAGNISPEWASQLGLPEHVKIGVGALDAHFGAVGAGIEPLRLIKVIGTSTCDMLVVPDGTFGKQPMNGICGQVDGSIIPQMLGFEAGQSAFGDLYAWFQHLLTFPLKFLKDTLPAEKIGKAVGAILPTLAEEASALPVGEYDIVALDWINGRRTPHADLEATASMTGIRLGSSAAHIFKALVEATAFGSRAIIDHFKAQGVPITEVVAVGGIAGRSPYVMQTLADIANVPIRVMRSEQACALGAAMFAATVAQAYSSVQDAQLAMAPGIEVTYLPVKERTLVYEKLYLRYKALGNCQKV